MQRIKGDDDLLRQLEANRELEVSSQDDFVARYDTLSEIFHSYFGEEFRKNQIDNCAFHKGRYIALAGYRMRGTVLDIGNDKPFLSYYLRKLNPTATFHTISFDIPQTPFDLQAIDIESEPLPFFDQQADHVLLAEVIEHLWRDPAFTIAEINRVLKKSGELYLTTPNPCEVHAITCVLWQANPNQRGQYFSSLESGHLHLWSSADLRRLLEANGFQIPTLTSFNPYGYTDYHENIVQFIKSITPHFDLMGESLLVVARKARHVSEPTYPRELFPDGSGVKFTGALRAFAAQQSSGDNK